MKNRNCVKKGVMYLKSLYRTLSVAKNNEMPKVDIKAESSVNGKRHRKLIKACAPIKVNSIIDIGRIKIIRSTEETSIEANGRIILGKYIFLMIFALFSMLWLALVKPEEK